MRLFLQTLLLAIAVLAWVPGVSAQDQSVFQVKDVAVDVTARSASDARTVAILQGERMAFSRLFRKLVAEEDWALEPTLANEDLTALVQGFDVSDERSSSTRYLANLNVTFDAEKIRSYLGSLGVSFAETRTRPTLILPLLTYAGTDVLWGSQNTWMQAWRDYPLSASLINYHLPENSAADWTTLSPRHLHAKRTDRVNAAMARYDVSDVILAHAELKRAALPGSASLNISISRGQALSPLFELLVSQQPGEDVAQMMHRAIERIDATLSEAWKSRVLIQYGSQQHIEAHVAVEDFTSWRAMVAKLETIPQIRDLSVDSLGFDTAQLSFDFYGGIEQLRVAMEEQGLTLREESEGAWRIAEVVREEGEQ